MIDDLAVGSLRTFLTCKLNLTVSAIELRDKFIGHIVFSSQALGTVEIRALTVDDMSLLYDFFFQGLSEDSRRKYHPYPLLHTPPSSVKELVHRFYEWKKEGNWIFLCIIKDGVILAISELKRIGTEHVTSSIAVRDNLHGKGVGYLLRMIVVEQARLLAVPRFHVKVVPENVASIRLHEKCGFVKVGEEPYIHIVDGKKVTEGVLKMEIIL